MHPVGKSRLPKLLWPFLLPLAAAFESSAADNGRAVRVRASADTAALQIDRDKKDSAERSRSGEAEARNCLPISDRCSTCCPVIPLAATFISANPFLNLFN